MVDALERERVAAGRRYTHANFFAAFRTLGINDPIRGHGRLLASLSEDQVMRHSDAHRPSPSLHRSPLLAAGDARAQSVADFYRGKTIEFLVGGAAGGGYDVAARTIANHMPRHIPGNPAIVVRNMPGATGLVMTNHLYNVARRDGTVIGMPTSNVPIEPRLKLISPDGSNVKFDIGRMSWIGTPLQEPQVTWVWHTAPAKSRRRPQDQRRS